MPKLLIHLPDGTSSKYGLNGPSFTIGRSTGNDIVLPPGAASSHHAVLKMNETGDFTLTDLESTNKTSLNGRPVQTAPLQHGDTLLFGDIPASYESEILPTGRYLDDQPTQIYEHTFPSPSAPTDTVRTTASAIPAASPNVTVRPSNIRRPTSTTRRSTHSSEGGCFALIVFAFVLPAAFFIGIVIRHHQEKGQWFWTYLSEHFHR